MSGAMRAYRLLEAGVAVWRVSFALVNEEGPGRVFRRIRSWSGVRYIDGVNTPISYNDYTPLVCIWCTSMYVAAISLFVPQPVLRLFAISGVTVLLDKCLNSNKA